MVLWDQQLPKIEFVMKSAVKPEHCIHAPGGGGGGGGLAGLGSLAMLGSAQTLSPEGWQQRSRFRPMSLSAAGRLESFFGAPKPKPAGEKRKEPVAASSKSAASSKGPAAKKGKTGVGGKKK